MKIRTSRRIKVIRVEGKTRIGGNRIVLNDGSIHYIDDTGRCW